MSYAGYSTSPERDASRYHDTRAAWQERQARAEEQCAEDFLRTIKTPGAVALFAKRRNGTCPPMVEVFLDTLEYADFPRRVMEALALLASIDSTTQELLNDMARDYASRNVEVD